MIELKDVSITYGAATRSAVSNLSLIHISEPTRRS